MAYNGDYLAMMSADAGKNGPRCFCLRTTDADATVLGAGYISDATERGIRLGDSILIQKVDDLTTPTTIESEWFEVSAVVAGAATVRGFTNLT